MKHTGAERADSGVGSSALVGEEAAGRAGEKQQVERSGPVTSKANGEGPASKTAGVDAEQSAGEQIPETSGSGTPEDDAEQPAAVASAAHESDAYAVEFPPTTLPHGSEPWDVTSPSGPAPRQHYSWRLARARLNHEVACRAWSWINTRFWRQFSDETGIPSPITLTPEYPEPHPPLLIYDSATNAELLWRWTAIRRWQNMAETRRQHMFTRIDGCSTPSCTIAEPMRWICPCERCPGPVRRSVCLYAWGRMLLEYGEVVGVVGMWFDAREEIVGLWCWMHDVL